MKSFIAFTLVVFSLVTVLNGQELMTIGEVFDFEINDEFHFSGNAPDQPPNADRITIIDKYYSVTGDTLNYVQSHDSYYTYIIYDPEPHLEYHFWTSTVTVQYYNLDSSLYYYDEGFSYDTSIYFNEYYCDSLVNQCQWEVGQFEPDYYNNIYGRGLGLIHTYLFQGGGPITAYDISMFYYKKGEYECGIPDTTIVGVKQYLAKNKTFKIFPNPTRSYVSIQNPLLIRDYRVKLFNNHGHLIKTKNCSGELYNLDLSELNNGVYFLEIFTNNKVENFKIIKN